MIKYVNKIFSKFIVIGILFGLSSFAQEVTVDEDKSNFLEGIQVLTSTPHRLGGTEEFDSASDYIVRELKKGGYTDENIIEQEFFLPQMLTEASITVGGKELPIYGVRANLWQGSALENNQVEAEIFYAGDGSPEAYGEFDPLGKIVCLNYATARRWRDAFAMGAKAVIFVDQGDIPQEFERYSPITADLPRFYIHRSDFNVLGLENGVKQAKLKSKPVWKRLTSRNIIAWLPGTEPVFDLEKEEVVILTAQLDSFGDVPELANGATDAANSIALLDLAKKFQNDKPRRSIMFVFLGGEGRLLTGSQNLYNAIFRDETFKGSRMTHTEYLENYIKEQEFITQMRKVLSAKTFFDEFTPISRQVLVRLRDYTQSESGEYTGLIGESNLLKIRLEKQGDEANAAKIQNIENQIEEWNIEKGKWDSLRRAIGKQKLDESVSEQLDIVIDMIDENLEARYHETEKLIAQKKQAKQIAELLKGKHIIFNLSLDFSGSGPLWGFSQWDSEDYLPQAYYNTVGYYVGVFSAIEKTADELGSDIKYLQKGTTKIRLGPDMYFPGKKMYSGMIAARFGLYGLRVGTCSDALVYQGHPEDTYLNCNVDKIYDFSQDFYTYAKTMFSSPEFSLRHRVRSILAFLDYTWDGERVSGSTAMTRSKGSAIANTPAAGAMLGIASPKMYMPGYDLAIRTVVEQNGSFVIGPVDYKKPLKANWNIVMFDDDGKVNSCNELLTNFNRVDMFPCIFKSVVTMSPPSLTGAKTLVLNAANDGGFRSQDSFAMETPFVTSSFMPETALGVKYVNKFGMLLINSTEENPLGEGFPVAGNLHFSTPKATAQDKFSIDESRLDILRKKRITNDSLEWLQGLASTALEKASSAKNIATKYAEYNTVNLLNKRIYAPVLTSMNDLVKAVVILMILMIPFAYALERLLIGTPHIYKQIGWYCFFFILTFVILYNVHPAFAIATEPIVIFLAFLIIILSSMVIFILLSRFQQEIKAVQGMEVTVHTADVSRFSTIVAAIGMGISTMRRRPMRTFLTTITVILLTFSILSFASFDAQGGIFKRHIGSSSSVKSIFVHHPVWNTLANRVGDISKHIMRGRGTVTERYWLSAIDAGSAQIFCVPVSDESGEKVVKLDALVGLETMDVLAQPQLLEAFRGDSSFEMAEDAIYFTETTVEALGVAPGDKVNVMGHTFIFAGLLDQNRLIRFIQIDNTPIYPIDYNDESMQKDTGMKLSGEGENEDLDTDSSFLPYLNSSVVAFVSSKRAKELNGRLVAISVYPNKGVNIGPIAEELARLAPAPVYATLDDGIYRLYFTTMLATSGLQNIIIPIILGGLIIFGTMLGSVTDREKEIYTFSALGLAPAHIGMLFFAESSVYAVIGGLGGYIFAQLVAIFASWLATFTSIQIPEMNYSSTNAIFAILVVMATVLLSTIYPAYRGAKSANPGVARSWKTPKPDGDRWIFTFPFTVSEYDITGVMSFLLEHFNNFSDCSLGIFLAENNKVTAVGKQLTLESHIATAPFDLGVTQEFRISSVPSEIEGVDEVHISIIRVSGTQGDWRRTNRPFINDLRKQFLIWRSLPPETMEDYRKKTLVMLGRAKADKEVTNNG